MSTPARFSEIAVVAGDPARAAMLHALMDGRALTASELAQVAGVTPQTASGHLARLLESGLLQVAKQGRHRYHRLANPAVARMMESIMQVAATAAPARASLVVGPRDAALRAARTCYDHLAGRLGVALADALVAAGEIELADDAGVMTASGIARMRRLGIDLDAALPASGRKRTRMLCRPCLDWSERRAHLAGALGAAICAHCFAQGWIRRVEGSRAVSVTPKGAQALQAAFGVDPG
ncbi:MAG: helix-turn-helix transcriptional regulator [Alphaproteobacteria bacterium]|nr:helix-turn-helix transcriptional regulator [Alphaproteobacteria bacterium]